MHPGRALVPRAARHHPGQPDQPCRSRPHPRDPVSLAALEPGPLREQANLLAYSPSWPPKGSKSFILPRIGTTASRAAGDPNRWWDHNEPDYWPAHATRWNRIDSLVEVFAGLGFQRCRDSRTKPGFRKVALYEQQGAWTHAAVQMPRGAWLGRTDPGLVIEHRNPELLAGGAYGNPTIHMQRSLRT